jgi:hypothetical protein
LLNPDPGFAKSDPIFDESRPEYGSRRRFFYFCLLKKTTDLSDFLDLYSGHPSSQEKPQTIFRRVRELYNFTEYLLESAILAEVGKMTTFDL